MSQPRRKRHLSERNIDYESISDDSKSINSSTPKFKRRSIDSQLSAVSIDKSIKRVMKHKTLRKSQRYYVKKYKKANFIQMTLLYITDYLYRIVLYIKTLFRR